MAYETGTATSPTDLLDKMRLFFVANGWALNLWAAVGSGYRLHLQCADIFVNLRSGMGDLIFGGQISAGAAYDYCIGGNLSNSFDAGTLWDRQPGAPQNRFHASNYLGSGMCIPSAGVTAYYFHANPGLAFVAIKFPHFLNPAIERWCYLMFGNINKFFNFPGGAFFSSNRSYYTITYGPSDPTWQWNYDYTPFHYTSGAFYPTSLLRINYGAIFDKFACNGVGGSNYRPDSVTGDRGTVIATLSESYPADIPNYAYIKASLLNQMNALAVMMPITIFYYDGPTQDNGNWAPMGQIPDVYYTKTTGFTGGNQYAFAGSNWGIYPNQRQLAGTSDHGLAVKVIT